MRKLSEYLKESTPSAMPNMGDVQNGDIANDVGDTFDPNFKKGTDIPSNGKKKDEEEE